ncbi:MAG: hypothetical protein ACNFW9_02410 [Candidatus Kerfeldbacteria bacterium]|jgi:hypothetical protein
MILLSHVVTGAVIGEKLNNPFLISAIGLASHYILDRVLHWNYKVPGSFSTWKFMRILPDIIPSILVYLFFIFSYPEKWFEISLGVAFAIMPDFATLFSYIPYIKKLYKPLHKLHKKIQSETTNVFLGLTTQILYIAFLLLIFKYF